MMYMIATYLHIKNSIILWPITESRSIVFIYTFTKNTKRIFHSLSEALFFPPRLSGGFHNTLTNVGTKVCFELFDG